MLRKELFTIAKTPLLKSTLWEFIFDDNPLLTFFCQSVSLPFDSFETETSKLGTKHYTAVTFIEEVSLTFIETENLDVLKFYTTWINTIYDKKTLSFRRINPHKNGNLILQKDIVNPLSLMDLSNELFSNRPPIAIYRFINMKPKSSEIPEFNYTDGGAKIITLTFAVDKIIQS